MDIMRLTRSVYTEILHTVGHFSPECGGILGAREDGIITNFFFDANGTRSPTGYAPDVASINAMLINDWMPRGILMAGIVHSHANGVEVPSCMDVGYGIRILQALDTVERFYLPIVTWIEGKPNLTGHVIEKVKMRFSCRNVPYEIIPLLTES